MHVNQHDKQKRLGATQAFLLMLLGVAEPMGAKRLSIVQLSSWTEESSGTKKNLRNQYKRALRSLTESELVIQDGCVVSVSGTATGELKEWAGKRVPAGYRRTALAFALTASGRLESHRLLTIATKKEVNFLSQKIEAAL